MDASRDPIAGECGVLQGNSRPAIFKQTLQPCASGGEQILCVVPAERPLKIDLNKEIGDFPPRGFEEDAVRSAPVDEDLD